MEFFEILFVACLLVNCTLGFTIETKLGRIEGFTSTTEKGKPMINFLGVPYAKGPIGDLRFRKPVMVEAWKGILQAKEDVVCMQNDRILEKKVIGREDCLVANVYIPGEKIPESKLPVMVYIHGGGYFIGSGARGFYGAERFLDYGIVLVTINYRLGPLGFLSTSNDDIPANLGLWDQRMSLLWVQKYIEDFGGDPGKVTIFGESAGGMSTMYQYLSPQTKGLFHGAIVQSGPATSTYSKVDKNPIYYARSLAAKLGCDPEASTKALADCLRRSDGKAIQEQGSLFATLGVLPNVFKPYIDDFNSEPFVPRDPWESIEKGEFNHVPLIIGNNQNEGLLDSMNYVNNGSALELLRERWEDEFGPLMIFSREFDEVDQQVKELTQVVSKFLLPGELKPNSKNINQGYQDIFSDTAFNAIGTITARKLAVKSKAPVFEYLYRHIGSMSFLDFLDVSAWKFVLKYIGQKIGFNLFAPTLGVAHADELLLMFKFHMIPLDTVYTEADKITSDYLLTLWTNFAKTGNPTPTEVGSVMWNRITDKNHDRLEIGTANLKINLDEKFEKRLEFWKTIWSQVPTYQRLMSSPTWTNSNLYKPVTDNKKDKKDEL